MASRKEQKAEGAARYAADELKSEREEKEAYSQQQQHDLKEHYGGSRGESHNQENKPGLMSSVIGALGSTYEHAKEVVTGKTHDAAEKTKETASSVSGSMKDSHDAAAVRAREDAALAREGRENAAENLKQTKDAAVGKTKEATGYVADKAVQAKDVTVGKTKDAAGFVADKAVQAKDRAVDTTGYVADNAMQAKDAAVGKAKDATGYVTDKAGQAKDVALDKTKNATGYVADRAKDAKDYTAQRAQEAKDVAAEKARVAADKTGEVKDKTVETAAEGKDTAVGKLGELKDSVMGFLAGKKDETKETAEAVKDKTVETAEAAKQKGREALGSAKQTAGAVKDKAWVKKEEAKDSLKGKEEEARRKMEETKIANLREKGYDAKYESTESATADLRGDSAANKNSLLGAIGSVTDAVKNKLTMPSDIVDEQRRTQGGIGGDVEKTVSVTIEESQPGAAIDLLKKAEQITGQGYTPNDVGKMGEEGTGMPGRRR